MPYVQEKLRERWSHEQITERLRLQAACLNLPLINFKTIYLWIQKNSDSSKIWPFKGYGKYLRLKRPGKVFSKRTKSAVRYLPDLSDIDAPQAPIPMATGNAISYMVIGHQAIA